MNNKKYAERLHKIQLKAYIQYEITWVSFKTPIISELLRSFLESQDFEIYIDKETGMTAGIWASGPYPEKEYHSLREIFKSYGVELPHYQNLQVLD